MKRLQRMTHASVYGARGELVEKAQAQLARRTPFAPETIRTLFCGFFLFFSVRRVGRALRAALRS